MSVSTMTTATATPRVRRAPAAPHWMAGELAFLLTAYPDLAWTVQAIALKLGRTARHVTEKAHRAGLSRPVVPVDPCSMCGDPAGAIRRDTGRIRRSDATRFSGKTGACYKCYSHAAHTTAKAKKYGLWIAKAQEAALPPKSPVEPKLAPEEIRCRWAVRLVSLARNGRPWHQLAPDLLDSTGHTQPMPTQAELIELTGVDPGPAPKPRRESRDAVGEMLRAHRRRHRDPLALTRVCEMLRAHRRRHRDPLALTRVCEMLAKQGVTI